MAHLEDAFRLQQVLQAVLPQVDQRHLGGHLVPAELRGAGRQQHLAAVSGGADPRSPVHLHAHVRARTEAPLTGVHTDADADAPVVGPGVPFERELRLDRSCEGSRCDGEDGEERITLGADDQAVVRLDRRPDDLVMPLEQWRVRLAEGLDEPRASLDVGEQERDGSRGQIVASAHAPS
jgi:hypothetical protein